MKEMSLIIAALWACLAVLLFIFSVLISFLADKKEHITDPNYFEYQPKDTYQK